jgi:GH3 auxin-responsive promoter
VPLRTYEDVWKSYLEPRYPIFDKLTSPGFGTTDPSRHWLGKVQTGVNGAVVVSTRAGMWGRVIGDTVRFDRLDPVLMTFTGRTKYTLSAFGEHVISWMRKRGKLGGQNKVPRMDSTGKLTAELLAFLNR